MDATRKPLVPVTTGIAVSIGGALAVWLCVWAIDLVVNDHLAAQQKATEQARDAGMEDGFRFARSFSTESDADTIERVLHEQHWIKGGWWVVDRRVNVPDGSAVIGVHLTGPGLVVEGRSLLLDSTFFESDDTPSISAPTIILDGGGTIIDGGRVTGINNKLNGPGDCGNGSSNRCGK